MFKKLFFVLMLVCLMGCSSPAQPTENVGEDPLPVEPEATNTVTVEPTATNPIPPLSFEIPDSEIPLAEPGPYEVAKIFNIQNHDESRDGRKVTYSIYFPSIDDKPDLRGAPFPLIINDGKTLSKFGEHLASHGFVVAGITGIGPFKPLDDNLYNQPLDYIFALNLLADSPPESLEGFIDSDHVGIWGYSFGGNNSMFMSGARLDPDHYFGVCTNPELNAGLRSYLCGPYDNWDQFAAGAGPSITESDDGLWQPITDDRIVAVMPMSSDNEILFGPEGLANTNKAVLITAGTFESLNYEGSYKAYQEFGSTDKTFISFVRANHDMIDGVSPPEKMEHLAIAFFSYHLKGYEEYSYYFSEDYISQIEGLAWGWYEE